MQTWLIVKLRIPGFHQWETAPKMHEYLKYRHRHEFHIKLEIRVDNNREYEFIQIKEDLHGWLIDTMGYEGRQTIDLCDIPEQSCEGFAEVIGEFIASQYRCKEIRVTVEEDGENGARIEIRSEG